MEEKKFNILSIISLLFALVGALVNLLWEGTNAVWVYLTLIILFPLLGLITSVVAKKQIKKNNQSGASAAQVSFVISIILLIIGVLSLLLIFATKNVDFNDQVLCEGAEKCTIKDDNTSTCTIYDIKIVCTTEKLKDSQFK